MSSRSSHDRYGKTLLANILGKRWVSKFDQRKSIDLGGVRADLDGIILSENLSEVECAVEIEATVYTQARSALLNLAIHPAPKKLLIVILAHSQMGSKEKATGHFQYVWEKLSPIGNDPFGLVVLQGTGAGPMIEVDRNLIEGSLLNLKVLSK
jgi:hypothetical protein